MSDAMLEEASGLCSDVGGDCGSWLAIPYFVSFMFLGTFIFLNLVVAVILENFSSLGNQRADLVAPSDIDLFKARSPSPALLQTFRTLLRNHPRCPCTLT